MKTEFGNLSAQQSLDIITNMIAQAKGNVKRNNFYFLLWGWVIALANLGVYALSVLEYAYPYIVWIVTIPTWIYTMYKGFQMGKSSGRTTHLDKVNISLWISFGIVVFTIVAFGYNINYQINTLILLIIAIPTFVSGTILKFRPLMFGAAAFWIFGIIGFLVPREIQPLIGAVAIICGYLVPGYLLKGKKSANV
jgi:hypothetical protein